MEGSGEKSSSRIESDSDDLMESETSKKHQRSPESKTDPKRSKHPTSSSSGVSQESSGSKPRFPDPKTYFDEYVAKFVAQTRKPEWEEYIKQVTKDPWNISVFPDDCDCALGRMSVEANRSVYVTVANTALDDFNQRNDTEFLLSKVVKCIGAKYGLTRFLTYEAQDPTQGIKTFKTRFDVGHMYADVIVSTTME